MVSMRKVLYVRFIINFAFNVAFAQQLSDSYESNTAEQKQTELWSILERENGTSSRYPTTWEYAQFVCEDVDLAVSHSKDFRPFKNKKGIHSVGAVAKATWKSVGNHSYTGLFDGETRAIVRLSLALRSGFTPGMGVKLFRDGLPSANFVAMFSIEPSSPRNFFHKNFSNHIPFPVSEVGSLIVGHQFSKVSNQAFRVGLSDISSFKQDGEKVDDPQFPFELRLQPNSNLTEQFEKFVDSSVRVRDQLKTIESGTKLYDVYALEAPNDTNAIKIAELFTDSEMLPSRAGDEFLFFQHQKVDEDFELRPDFNVLKDQEVSQFPFRDNLIFAGVDIYEFSLCPGIRFCSGRS